MSRSVRWARRYARHQRGQGIVEFVIAIGVFGTLLLGILQAGLLYRAKATVDYAAFRAAREGSLNGATQASVDAGLVRGLMPLYAHQTDIAGLTNAYAQAKAVRLAGQADVEIVSPTRAMFDQVSVVQFDGVQAIPNDDLAYRSDAVRAANQLKVKVTYDYPLIVPVVDALIGAVAGTRRPVLHADGSVRVMWTLPIEAQALVAMQSPIRDADALGGGGAGVPPGNGGDNPPPPVGPPDGSGGGGDGGICTGT